MSIFRYIYAYVLLVNKMEINSGLIRKDQMELNYVEICLHKTTLLLIEGYKSFFMCGALDTNVYSGREVVCGKALGVKTIEQLYNAPIVELSEYAKQKGLKVGMLVYEAFEELSKEK